MAKTNKPVAKKTRRAGKKATAKVEETVVEAPKAEEAKTEEAPKAE